MVLVLGLAGTACTPRPTSTRPGLLPIPFDMELTGSGGRDPAPNGNYVYLGEREVQVARVLDGQALEFRHLLWVEEDGLWYENTSALANELRYLKERWFDREPQPVVFALDARAPALALSSLVRSIPRQRPELYLYSGSRMNREVTRIDVARDGVRWMIPEPQDVDLELRLESGRVWVTALRRQLRPAAVDDGPVCPNRIGVDMDGHGACHTEIAGPALRRLLTASCGLNSGRRSTVTVWIGDHARASELVSLVASDPRDSGCWRPMRILVPPAPWDIRRDAAKASPCGEKSLDLGSIAKAFETPCYPPP